MPKTHLLILCITLSYSLLSFGQPLKPKLDFEEDSSKSLLLSDRVQETSVSFSPDGVYLYFSRDGATFNFGKENAADIWYSKLGNAADSWSAPLNLGPQLNTSVAEQIISICNENKVLYLSRKTADLPKLFRYESLGRRWSDPQEVIIPGLSDLSKIIDFSINQDERFLMVCAEKQGQTDLDIFYSIKNKNGEWSMLKALWLPFDQSANECSAYLASDNKTLYFATDGIKGFGGYDIFICRKQSASWNDWSEPENLGPNVNTAADDFGLSMPNSGQKIAYLSSLKSGQLKVYFSKTPDGMGPEQDLFSKTKSDR